MCPVLGLRKSTVMSAVRTDQQRSWIDRGSTATSWGSGNLIYNLHPDDNHGRERKAREMVKLPGNLPGFPWVTRPMESQGLVSAAEEVETAREPRFGAIPARPSPSQPNADQRQRSGEQRRCVRSQKKKKKKKKKKKSAKPVEERTAAARPACGLRAAGRVVVVVGVAAWQPQATHPEAMRSRQLTDKADGSTAGPEGRAASAGMTLLQLSRRPSTPCDGALLLRDPPVHTP